MFKLSLISALKKSTRQQAFQILDPNNISSIELTHDQTDIVGEVEELTQLITNMVSLSRHFRRAYYADRSFLQSTLGILISLIIRQNSQPIDNVFFSVNDVLPPKKSYKGMFLIRVMCY